MADMFELVGRMRIEGRESAESALQGVSSSGEAAESKLLSSFNKIAIALAAAFTVDKVIDFGKQIVNAAAEVDAEASAFEQIMGDFSDGAKEKLNAVADETGVMASRMTGNFTSLTAKFKGLGYGAEEATDMASRGLKLAADGAAFWDMSLDESQSHLNSFINGSYEGGEAIGLFANDTQMAMFAVEQGLIGSTKEWANLDEATKQATRLEYAENMYQQSGATGQAAKEAGQYANVQANLTEKWRQFQAQIGQPLLQNIVIPAMNGLSSLIDVLSEKFTQLTNWVQQNQDKINALKGAFSTLTDHINIVIGVVGAMVAAWAGFQAMAYVGQMGSLAAVMSKVTTAVKAATVAKMAEKAETLALQALYAKDAALKAAATVKTLALSAAQKGAAAAQWLLNAAMSANPLTLIIIAIVAVVAAFVLLWNKSDAFRNFFIGLWEAIKTAVGDFATFATEKLNAFAQWLLTVWDGAKEAASTVWNAIQSVVTTVVNAIQIVISTVFAIIQTIITIYVTAYLTVITAVWNAIQTVITTVINAIQTVITTVWAAIQTVITIYVNAIKTVITTVFNAVRSTVSTVWNAIKTAITTPINAAKSTVSSVVNGIRSTVSSVFNSIKSTASSVWNGIKSAMINPIQSAKDKISSIMSSIKSKFPFKLGKLINFSIPSISLNTASKSVLGKTITYPTGFSVNWHAKGGIFDQPTLLPSLNGLEGVGEAGAEAITPIDTLLDYVRTAVAEQNAGMTEQLQGIYTLLAQYLPQVGYGQVVMDTGVLVGQIAPSMDRKLGKIYKNQERGRG